MRANLWDLETVPDLGGFAAANDLVGKSDGEPLKRGELACKASGVDRSAPIETPASRAGKSLTCARSHVAEAQLSRPNLRQIRQDHAVAG
jgi:hypothetical protein